MEESTAPLGAAGEAPPTQTQGTPAASAQGTPASPARTDGTPAPPTRTDGTPASPPPQTQAMPAGAAAPPETPPDPGFLERGGLRRRLRFLRKTRELAYRDLGGLLFEMHRLGQQRDDLLRGKLVTLGRIDSELRAIEDALHERRGVTVLREAGVTACPRCAAIHGSEDRFCPACGFSMGRAERPIAANPVAAPVAAPVGTPAAAPATAPPDPTARPSPSPFPSPSITPPPAAPAAAPVSAQRVPLSAPAGRTPAPAVTPGGPGRAPSPPPPPPPPPLDQPTEIVEPPTQIVRPAPASGEPPDGKSNGA